MRKRMFFVMLVSTLSFVTERARAREIHVPADYATIQLAVAAAATGDEIYVAPDDPVADAVDGITGYSDGTWFSVPSGVAKLIGEGGPTQCTIGHDGGYDPTIIELLAGPTEFAGFLVAGNARNMPQGLVMANAGNVVHDLIMQAGAGYELSMLNASAYQITAIGHGQTVGISAHGSGTQVHDCIITNCVKGMGTGDGFTFGERILFDNCEQAYYGTTEIGLTDLIGTANLNTSGIPVPPSDAFGMRADGLSVGALPWKWNSSTVDLQLFFEGGGNTFHAGDACTLHWSASHPICGELPLDLAILLDVYGRYYFWPMWDETPNWQLLYLPDEGEEQEVFSFTWPTGVGTLGPVPFYAAAFVTGDISEAGLLSVIASTTVAGK